MLEVKGGAQEYARNTYLKFDISNLASASSVTLRLNVRLNDVGSVPLALYGISATANWQEGLVTYNNRPATSSKLGQTTVSSTTEQWIEFDVTGYVQGAIAAGRSDVSFGLTGTTSTSPFIRVASRESANAPQLSVVGTAGVGGENPTNPTTPTNPTNPTVPSPIGASADAYVNDGASATTNFGGGTSLAIKKSSTAGYNRQAYLKFDISSLTSINSAKLILSANLNTADSVQMAIFGANDSGWNETGLTWNNKPATSGGAIATTVVSSTSVTQIEIDLTSYVQQAIAAGKTSITLNLQGTASSTAFINIASRESGAGPELVFG